MVKKETNPQAIDSSQVLKSQETTCDDYEVVPPDGGWAWIVTAGCFLAILISDGILFSFGLILSELERVYDAPAAKVAWVFSILNGISLISGPLVSALSNRFSFRAVVFLGSFLGFVGLTTSTFAQSVDILFFTLGVLFGLAVGLIFNPIVVAIGFYFVKRRALATAIVVCGSGAGTFIFAPLIHWLLENYAIRGTFLILGAIVLNSGVFGSFLVPIKPKRRKQPLEGVKLLPHDEAIISVLGKPTTQDEDVKSEDRSHELSALNGNGTSKHNNSDKEAKNTHSKVTHAKRSKGTSLSSIFKFSLMRSPTLVVICISSFFQCIGWFVPFVYLAAHAVKVGVSKESASFLLSLVGICSMIGRLLYGLIADHPKVSVLLLNNIALSVSGLLIIFCPLFTSYELLVFFSVLLGLALSCTAVTRPILLGKLLGLENVNNAFGFMLMFCGIGTLFGTPLSGFLYDTLGDYHGTFYLSGSSVLFSAFLCYPLGWINRLEKKRRNVPAV